MHGMEWLDLKDENYVVYVSFGSQNTISASQMMALAEGLEKSGRSFIWVVRPPMLVEEMGVAVELTRSVETTISGEEVKKAIDIVMDKEGKGKEMKEKAKEIASDVRKAITDKGEEKGSSLRAMDDLVRTFYHPTLCDFLHLEFE
ncbi:hypothetical protein VNO80_06038 [Phaseolus coccineus]|uniref:Uncharacterized protein n=1 Tax=Phaseolus coccineus TaxID=3886 RepID=A0AAN9RH94_PHACN